jgi:predicted membrane protein
MDLFITLLIILIIVFWPKHGQIRYYLLLFAGMFILFITVLFAPVLFLSPLFYIGLAVSGALMIYKVITKDRHEGKK